MFKTLLIFLLFSGCETLVESEGATGTEMEHTYGCTDPDALNYNELATHDDGSCQYEIGELSIEWVKTYEDIGDESWRVRKISDGGFIIAGAANSKVS